MVSMDVSAVIDKLDLASVGIMDKNCIVNTAGSISFI